MSFLQSVATKDLFEWLFVTLTMPVVSLSFIAFFLYFRKFKKRQEKEIDEYEKVFKNILYKNQDKNFIFSIDNKNLPKDKSSMEKFIKIVKQEENKEAKKKEEVEGGFLKILKYLRSGMSWYSFLIALFLILTILSGCEVIYIFTNFYHSPFDVIGDGEITIYKIVSFGFFLNIRFYLLEGIFIGFLVFFVKRIFCYIAMIETYKLYEALLIMDVQKTGKDYASDDFINQFKGFIGKHENSFLSGKKNEINFNPPLEVLKNCKEIIKH